MVGAVDVLVVKAVVAAVDVVGSEGCGCCCRCGGSEYGQGYVMAARQIE